MYGILLVATGLDVLSRVGVLEDTSSEEVWLPDSKLGAVWSKGPKLANPAPVSWMLG